VAARQEIGKEAEPTELIEASDLTKKMRVIKDEAEVGKIRASLKVTEEAFTALREAVRVGQTELEMAARLEYEMKRRGSLSPAFSTICAEGPNAALPHAHPGRRKVVERSAVLFDWGATVDFYCADLTRVVFIGSIPDAIREVYEIVLAAQRLAIAAVKPGARMYDVDKVARDHIASAGFGDAFNHSLGHGLGLCVHEAPALSWRSSEAMEAGMVVTVEPGVYLPGVGGVRIEDDVLVTPRGSRVLSKLEKTPDSAIIRG